MNRKTPQPLKYLISGNDDKFLENTLFEYCRSFKATAHGQGDLFFKPETASPSGTEGSTAFGGRATLCAYQIRITSMAHSQRVRRPPSRADSSSAVLNA
jgi:hypothetical protein